MTAAGTLCNTERLQKHDSLSSRRHTDRHWIGLFVVIFIVWIVAWHYLAYEKNDKANDNTTISISPEVVHNMPEIKIHHHNSKNTMSPYVSTYWGKNWIFDTLTFNVGFLDANYQKDGIIVVWTNGMFAMFMIIFALGSMRSDHVFCNQLAYFGRPLIGFLFYYRFLMYLPNSSKMMSMIPFDKKIIFWVIPEIIFIMIWATKKSPKDKDDKDDKENDNGDEEQEKDDEAGKIVFRKFMGYVGVIGVTLFASIEILMLVTSTHVYQMSWDNPLFYVIVGGSLYVGLTFFYFGLMVIACATRLSIDSQKATIKDVMHALLIVGLRHFGTACYHATLIFPRLHSSIVMNEVEFRKIRNFSVDKRFLVTHFNAHNVSPILTAVRGQNHSGSMRELLRLFTSRSSKVKHFQGFSAMSKSFLLLFVTTNALTLTMLWAHGAVVDPRFMMGTWVMYLAVMFFNYIFMRAHDAAADAIWLHVDNEDMVKF